MQEEGSKFDTTMDAVKAMVKIVKDDDDDDDDDDGSGSGSGSRGKGFARFKSFLFHGVGHSESFY